MSDNDDYVSPDNIQMPSRPCEELVHSEPKRYHPSATLLNHPPVQAAFKTIGAILMATKAKDLECDFMMTDDQGRGKQYHIEVTEVAEL